MPICWLQDRNSILQHGYNWTHMFLFIDFECTPFLCGLEVYAECGYARDWFVDFDKALLHRTRAIVGIIISNEDAAGYAQITIEPRL